MSKPPARRIIDLTYPIEEGMTTFPAHWHPAVEVTLMGRHETEHRETRRLVLGTHTGTHCDAPRHFIPGGATVDQLSLDVLIGPARVLDFSKARAKQAIEIADLKRQLGTRRPERLLLRFDWSRHWKNPSTFYSDHPYLSEAAADWLVKRGVRLVGIDTPMPDNPKNAQGTPNDSPIHKILLGRGVVLVEYLCNLKALRRKDVDLIVLPLKVTGGDGAPARCVAIES